MNTLYNTLLGAIRPPAKNTPWTLGRSVQFKYQVIIIDVTSGFNKPKLPLS